MKIQRVIQDRKPKPPPADVPWSPDYELPADEVEEAEVVDADEVGEPEGMEELDVEGIEEPDER